MITTDELISLPAAGGNHDAWLARRRVLFVSYAFPPVGGAGVQRVTKFVKYLGRYGWQPSVLTVANPSVPVFDHSLDQEIPSNTKIVRVASWEPSYHLKTQVGGERTANPAPRSDLKRAFVEVARRIATALLQPDPQILWYPGAVREGKRLLRSIKHDAIVATAPPFSALLVGAALARHARLPLIVDYRDEWTLSNKYWENKKLGMVTSLVQSSMERAVLRAASGVLATTRSSAESLREHCQRARSSATVNWIYNGYDSEDFANRSPAARDFSRFRLLYMGTLWNLTSVIPVVQAVGQLAIQFPELIKRLELVFVGRCTSAQAAYVESLRALPCRVVTHDYLDHSAALDLLCGADASCLLLSDVPGAERVVPAKLFEYLASRRPILALIPRGETWELLNQYSQAHRFLPGETQAITQWLANAIQSSSEIQTTDYNPTNDLSRFARESQAGQLADFLSACCRQAIQ